jgi:hypothetical protein
MQVEILEGVFDELGKIAARKGQAGFMQSRRGTRPHRVANLLSRDTAPNVSTHQHPLSKADSVAQDPEKEQPPPAATVDGEESEKSAEKKWKERKTQALSAFAKARPYAVSGIKAGVPAAVLGGIMGAGKEGARGSRAAKIFGALGAGAGMANQAIKDWAEKNKRKAVAKEILAK